MATILKPTGQREIQPDPEKLGPDGRKATDVSNKGEDSDDSSQYTQDGVRRVEAVTQVWSKTALWSVFFLLYLVSFIDTLFQSVTGNLDPYVTSSFGKHGLLAIVRILPSIVGGACKLAIAKVIDIRGRCEGFLLMIGLIVVGILMKALCRNVETYAAGETFYWIGHFGLGYVVHVILADMTSLRNRMIMWGIYMSPRIAASFGGPRIAQLFFEQSSFRWAFGAFVIILVAFSIPVAAVLVFYERKAKKLHIIEQRESRTAWEATKYYFIEFDVIGMMLTIAGFSLVLLPLQIAKMAPNGWKSGYIIAMLVLGVLCLVGFGVWEKWFAKVPYLPFKYLRDRTILGACLLEFFLFISIFCWDTYYGSYLQVVHDLSISTSGYTLNAYSLTSTVLSPFVGLFLRWYGRYYWVAISGIPFSVLGTALLYHFRHPGEDIGYLVMCQVFHGISGAFWGMTGPLALMAAVSHREVAVVLAVHSMFASIGASIGFGISGALWTNHLPRELYRELPDAAKNQTAQLYGDLKKQKADPIGTPIRDAVIRAYGTVQREMVIAGCAILPLVIACVVVWKNRPIDRKQTKGNVF
ncbi:hypothetical protein RJ55_06629 [Drechmeria coniospora]|nr:hypothetical protein RJ55_06629 [Drechmeria coniospora]